MRKPQMKNVSKYSTRVVPIYNSLHQPSHGAPLKQNVQPFAVLLGR